MKFHAYYTNLQDYPLWLLLSELTFTSSNTSVITYYCFVFQKKILDFKKGDEKKVAEAEA